MRLLIYGGRDFKYENDHVCYLNDLRLYFEMIQCSEIVVVSGGARGADKFGEDWAHLWELEVNRYPANWELHGKAAGHIRNQLMLDSGLDAAVQFPGGRGTDDMRRRLDKAKVKVYEYPK